MAVRSYRLRPGSILNTRLSGGRTPYLPGLEYVPQSTRAISLDRIDQTAATFTPTVTPGVATVSLALINQTASPFAPTISTTAATTLALIDQTASPFTPTVTTANAILLALIDRTATTFTPIVADSSGGFTVELDLLDATAATFAPTLNLVIYVGFIDQTAACFAPALDRIELPLIDQTAVANDVWILTGNNRLMELQPIIQFAEAYELESVYANAPIVLGLITNSPTMYAPTLTHETGQYSYPDLIASTVELFPPRMEYSSGHGGGTATADCDDAVILRDPPFGTTTFQGDTINQPGTLSDLPRQRPRILDWTQSSNGGGSTSLFVNNLAEGTLLQGTYVLLFITYDGGGAHRTITPPGGSGWFSVLDFTTPNSADGMYVFMKQIFTSDSDWTFTISASVQATYNIVWVDGVGEVALADFYANNTTNFIHTSDDTIVTEDGDLLLAALGKTLVNVGQDAAGFPLQRVTATNSTSTTSESTWYADTPVNQQLQFSTFGLTGTPTMMCWIVLRGRLYETAYAGWTKLQLDYTAALTLDTFGSTDDMDTMLAVVSQQDKTVPYRLIEGWDFGNSATYTSTGWPFGPFGQWYGGNDANYRVSGFGYMQTGNGSRHRSVDLSGPITTSPKITAQALFRWDRYGTTTDAVSLYLASAGFFNYVGGTIYYSSSTNRFEVTVEASDNIEFIGDNFTIPLPLQAQLTSAFIEIEVDLEARTVGTRYWSISDDRPADPQVQVSFPETMTLSPDTFEIDAYHAAIPTSGVDWRFSDVTLIGERTIPAGQLLYINDDTDVEPYTSTSGQELWSSVPTGTDGELVPIIFEPGTYCIVVWPIDADFWDQVGEIVLNITRYPVTAQYEWVDDKNDVNTVTDPPIGETFVVSDFSLFSAAEDPTDPNDDGMGGNWDTNYSGWFQMVLTEDMWLAMDTYPTGADPEGMYDPVLFVWKQLTAPTGDDVYYLQNDDNSENPYTFDERYDNQSLIAAGFSAPSTFLWEAGTYWILAFPYSGEFWLNPPVTYVAGFTETGILSLRITRTDGPTVLPVPRGQLPTIPRFRPEQPGHSVIKIVYDIDGPDELDITEWVKLSTAQFTYQVGGSPGTMNIEVRDDDQTMSFVTGRELVLFIDGRRWWGGYVMQAQARYPLPVQDTTIDAGSVSRIWALSGPDYNILFQKRIVHDDSDNAGHIDFHYDVGTYDDTVVNDIFDNYVDIEDDGLNRGGVHRVDVITVDIPGVTTGKGSLLKGKSAVASAGYTWKQAMDVISRATGAIYYISPTKTLHYVDVDTADNERVLTDTPSGVSDLPLQNFRLLNNGSGLINRMYVWGAGNKPVVFSLAEDTNSIDDHNLWEESLFTTGIYRQATADVVADSYVYGTPQSQRGGKDDAVSLMVRTFQTSLYIGEKIETRIGIFDFEDVLPARRITITFANPTQPIYDIVLSHSIDQPWSIFERPPLNIDIPTFTPPYIVWPPPTCVDGLQIPDTGAFVLDNFSRTILDTSLNFPGSHDVGNYNEDWGFGDRVAWHKATIVSNNHFSVHNGYGIIHAMNAHYVLVNDNNSYYPSAKRQATTIGDIDFFTGEPISIQTLTFVFRIQPRERTIQATITDYIVSNRNGFDNLSYITDFTGFPEIPDLDTRSVAGAGVANGPTSIYFAFEPVEAADITGTVIVGDIGDDDYAPAGIWYGSDGGGMVNWQERYANGAAWRDGMAVAWAKNDSRLGLHYYSGAGIEGLFYTAVDERTGGDWINKVNIEFKGSGSSKITIDRHEGGGGAYGITTSAQSGGSSHVQSDGAMIIDPALDYICKWYRPSIGESYVKIWLAGAGEPDFYIASDISNASHTPAEPGRALSIGASVFNLQEYDLMIKSVVAGEGVTECPPPGGGQSGGQQGGYQEYTSFDGTDVLLAFTFVKGSSQVWVDGLRVRLGHEYIEHPEIGVLEFTPPISPDAEIHVMFIANGVY